MENKKDIPFIHSLRDVRGASIVIALSMIAAIMFFTIGMASTMIMAIQNTSDSKKAVQAEYAAQAGVELANFTLRDIESAKLINDGGSQCFDTTTCSNTVSYTFTNVDTNTYTTPYAYYRSVPVKGYGNAASSCINTLSPDDPCNWNKMYYGDSIEIPLYIINSSGTAVNLGASMSEFFIRVRTPCIDGSLTGCERFKIAPAQNDQVINWQFIGESCVNTSCIVGPKDFSSYISGENIRSSVTGSYKILNISSTCKDSVNPDVYNGSIQSFLKNQAPWTTDKNNALYKPKLKLSYVKNLLGENSTNIPYVEYQILYWSTSYPLPSMYMVGITGSSSGFKYKLNGVQSLGAGLFDFAVQN